MPPALLVIDELTASGDKTSGAVSALDYIKGVGADLPPGTLIRNVAADYAYLSLAYYVSLLAEARGHIPFPRVVDLLRSEKDCWRLSPPTRPVRDGGPALARALQSGPRTLGVLFTPADKFRASCRASLADFARAAADCDVEVKLIGQRHIMAALDSLSALFIRDLAQPDNHTFSAALKAEALQVPVIDSPAAIVSCSDKVCVQDILDRRHVPTPRTILVTPDKDIASIVAELGLPLVLKIPDGSFSVGVHKARTVGEGERILAELRARYRLLIAQEYIPTDYDWRIGVLAGEPLFACKYFMAHGHWQIVRHLGAGERVYGEAAAVPLREVPAEVIETARRAARPMGEGLYGVDIKQHGARACVIEVNANPDIDSDCEAALPEARVWPRLAEWFAARMRGGECERAAPIWRQAGAS